jgi:hypothetical protein
MCVVRVCSSWLAEALRECKVLCVVEELVPEEHHFPGVQCGTNLSNDVIVQRLAQILTMDFGAGKHRERAHVKAHRIENSGRLASFVYRGGEI